MDPTVTTVVCSVGAPVVHISDVPVVHEVVAHGAAPSRAEGLRFTPAKLLPKTVRVAPPVSAALPISCEAIGASNEKPSAIVPATELIVTKADASVTPVARSPTQRTEVSDDHEDVAQAAASPRTDEAE